MTNKICLNCENEITSKFCSECGQKTDTHRITFKNFIFHDILHGTFHIEKGMLFTVKQSLMRPGKAALDYISGKRKPYYNVFYLILITLGLILFIRHFYDQIEILIGRTPEPEKPYLNEASKTIDEFFSKKSKIIIFLFVPFGAINSFMLFKRKKLNLTEHTIIAGMILLGMLLISAFGNLIFYLDLIVEFSNSLNNILSSIVPVFMFLHILFGYYNAFGNDYSKWGITYRIILFIALICLEILILLFFLIGIVTHWKFGTISLSPFG